MAFERKSGFIGKIYVPDEDPQHVKKYDCKDCYFCKKCNEERCKLCRSEQCCARSKETSPGHYLIPPEHLSGQDA